jgi:hypothetical protein
LGIEPLEIRATPAILVVTGTGDNIAVDGFVTLREALTAANTNAPSGDALAGSVGLDTIKFRTNKKVRERELKPVYISKTRNTQGSSHSISKRFPFYLHPDFEYCFFIVLSS